MNNTLEIVIQKKPQKWRHIFEQFSNLSSERENQTTKRLPQTFFASFWKFKRDEEFNFFIEDVSVLKLHFSFEKKLKQRSFFPSCCIWYTKCQKLTFFRSRRSFSFWWIWSFSFTICIHAFFPSLLSSLKRCLDGSSSYSAVRNEAAEIWGVEFNLLTSFVIIHSAKVHSTWWQVWTFFSTQ